LLKLALFLVLGAIVNIAVAWGFSLGVERMTAQSPPPIPARELDVLWERYGVAEVKRTLTGWRETNIGTTVKWFGNNMPQYGVVNMGGACMDITVVDSGAPLRCVRHHATAAPFYNATWGGLPRGSEWFRRAAPIWPGFAINTVFYAAIMWLLFAAPFALRRRSRIRRGLCPKCAYDLRGSTPDSTTCPECGNAMVK